MTSLDWLAIVALAVSAAALGVWLLHRGWLTPATWGCGGLLAALLAWRTGQAVETKIGDEAEAAGLPRPGTKP